MTDGELNCEVCSPFEVPQVLGYQPLYHGADGRPCQVVVHDYARDQIDALKLHHPVTVSRGEGQTDTIALLPALSAGRKYTSSLAERMKPADLTETLLRMWRMPELTEWYRRTHGLGDNAMSLPTTSPDGRARVRSDGEPFSPLTQAAAARYGAPEGDAEAQKKYEETRDRLKKNKDKLPSETNGKH